MFQTVPLSIIRSCSLYTQQWYMSYMFADSLPTSCQQTCKAIACSPDIYPTYLYLTSSQQQPKNRTAHVVISTIAVSS